MNKAKRKWILVFVVVCSLTLIVVRTLRVYRDIEHSGNDEMRIQRSLTPEDLSAGTSSDTPGSTETFTAMWRLYVEKFNELTPDEFTEWFESWSRKLRGTEVQWRLTFRGSMNKKNERQHGNIVLVFRPRRHDIQRVARVRCIVPENECYHETLRYDDDIVVKGRIQEVVGQTRRLDINTIPLDSRLTVTLEQVTIIPPDQH